MVYGLATGKETLDRFDEVLAYRTTHTSIRDFDDFFGRLLDEISIDPSRAEFILNDRDLASLGISDYVIQESGLPTSKESCEDGYGDEFFHNFTYSKDMIEDIRLIQI